MNPEEREFLLELPFRMAVVHAPATGYPKPFVILWPEMNWRRLAQQELKERMQQSLEELRWVAGPETRPSEPRQETTASAGSGKAPLKALNYLEVTARTLPMPATVRDQKMARVSAWAGNQLRADLEKLGFIRLHRVSTGRRGGVLAIVEVTDAGYACLEDMGVKVPRLKGKGGFLHQWWQAVIYEHCRRAYPSAVVEIEDYRFGKAVDVGVHIKDRSIAFEVFHSGVQKELRNVVADAGHYEEIVMCCESPAAMEKLQEKVRGELDSEAQGKIRWRLLWSFIEEAGQQQGNGE